MRRWIACPTRCSGWWPSWRTPAFEQAHPVLRTAYAHYALVVVHPFADLNGRAARALASTFLLQAQQIPLVIFADQRNEYLDALTAADRV